MAQTSIGPNIDEPFDVHRYFFAKIPFDFMIPIDRFTQFDDLIFTEVLHTDGSLYAGLAQNLG
jgi:hypothetical protein